MLTNQPSPLCTSAHFCLQEKLYSLDLGKIRAGEDRRTTLMVKNIPNKYTQKMLLAVSGGARLRAMLLWAMLLWAMLLWAMLLWAMLPWLTGGGLRR